MDMQQLIRRRLGAPASLSHIALILVEEQGSHRTALAQRLCRDFGFYDARGRAQVSSCLAALRALERSGQVELPAGRTPGGSCVRQSDPVPVAPARDVPSEVCDVRGLSLVQVSDAVQRDIWHGLMATEHPRGAGPLVGCQLRYLVGSEHGWLGGVGIAASALQLSARDRWIGWDAATRRAHLHRVVGLTRYLIRPGIACRNLASHVLGQLLRRLPADFEARYGYAPWLVESFVDGTVHSGASLRAANWQRIGETSGRGRQDRDHAVAVGRKDVYVYALSADWRQRLGVGPAPALATDPLEPGDGVDGATWAEAEFGGASLGDARLAARLVTVAGLMGENPMASFPEAAKGDRSRIKGYYRFIDQPDSSAVTPESILQPHRERTLRRMRGEAVVLCLQDGTDLNFSARPGCAGLGVIGGNQTGVETRGLHLHSTIAVTPEGLPLGVLRAGFEAPPAKGEPRPERRKSARWIEGFRDCADQARNLRRTQVVCVMDREADIFALFEEQRARPEAELLVRAKGRRRVAGGTSLLETLRAAPACTWAVVLIDRLTARPKRSKRPKRPGRAQRNATLVMRTRSIELAPTDRAHRDKAPMCLQAVLVEEERTPEGVTPIQWVLLTTLPVNTSEDCRRIVEYYARRWRIEDWHRILKSGCKVEELANRSAERIARAATINLVIAWRILLMTLLGRDHPDLPPDEMFSELEIRVLKAFSDQQGLVAPDTLATAIRIVAQIGGYIHRARAPPPGTKVMWRGCITLAAMCRGFTLAMELKI